MSTQGERDFGNWAGAYSLHALTPEERARYEEHLRRSEDARAEAAELGDTAALLGLAVEPATPSAELRASLLAAIEDTPQLPALAVEGSEPSDEGGTVASQPAEPTGRADAPAAPPASAGGSVVEPASGSKAARRWKRPVALLAAAAAVVVLGVGIAGGTGLLTSQDPEQQAVAALQDADDLERVEATTTDGATVSVLWSDELASAAVLSDDLPALDDGLVYQLWMIRDDDAIPAGLLEAGETSAVMEGELVPGDVIGLTIEPAGGSEAPTTEPILVQAT